MLCLDLGTNMDTGKTGLGSVGGGGSLLGIGSLLLAFDSRLSSRCLRRPLRMTYVPRPEMSGTCGMRSSESEYRDAASSSVLHMGMSGGSGHSLLDSLFRLLGVDSKLDCESFTFFVPFRLPITLLHAEPITFGKAKGSSKLAGSSRLTSHAMLCRLLGVTGADSDEGGGTIGGPGGGGREDSSSESSENRSSSLSSCVSRCRV